MAGDRRVRAGEQAERVNAAADLLEAGVPAAEAARVLAGRFGVSVRQARRYADQARASGRAEVPGASVVFTVKLPAVLAGRERDHDLRRGHPRADRVPGAEPQKQSPQVNDRAVETESVFGRHAATELSVAYAILVPQRRARIRAGQEGRPPRDQRGDLRPGLQCPAEEGPDDRVADRGIARARRAGPA